MKLLLYTMRFKGGYGVTERFVEAEDLAQAEAVGRKWCEREGVLIGGGFRFISVAPTVVAGPEILAGDAGPESNPVPETVPERPSVVEQRQRRDTRRSGTLPVDVDASSPEGDAGSGSGPVPERPSVHEQRMRQGSRRSGAAPVDSEGEAEATA